MTGMYRAEIDGLRAIAVVAVIMNHIDKTLVPSGHLGVDIFYVISGFVITRSLVSRPHESFISFIASFYSRRVRRLVPALYVCVAITTLFVLLVISPKNGLASASLNTGVAALFGFSNIYLLKQATDYFGSTAELNPFTHTWSLGVEEQFYLIFPLFLWFSGLPNNKKRGFLNFSLLIAVAATASLVSYIRLSSSNPTLAFYLMPTRFWELSLGTITYLGSVRSQQVAENYPRLSQIITLSVLPALVTILFLPQRYISQELITLSVAALTACLIFWVRSGVVVYKLLTLKLFLFLGVISYSLYLWHWSVLTICRWTVGVDARSIPFQLVTILLLAVTSYRFIERPLRYRQWHARKLGNFRLSEVGYAVVSALAFSVLIVFIVTPLHARGHFYSGVSAPLIKKGVNTLEDSQNYKGYAWLANRCILTSNDDVGKVISPENCTFGDFHSGKRRFLVIGNSFSAAEIEMFKILVDRDRGSVTVTSSWGASAVPEIENNGAWGKANSYYWNTVVPGLMSELRTGDVVLMINDGAEFSPKEMDEGLRNRLAQLGEGLMRVSGMMSNRGISVIYQSGNPFIRESECTPDTAVPQWWSLLRSPPCKYYTRDESIRRRRMYHEALLDVQKRAPNFRVLDLFDVFCGPTEVLCRFHNEAGVFLYRDEWSHPSVEASILAQPALLSTVDEIIGAGFHRGQQSDGVNGSTREFADVSRSNSPNLPEHKGYRPLRRVVPELNGSQQALTGLIDEASKGLEH